MGSFDAGDGSCRGNGYGGGDGGCDDQHIPIFSSSKYLTNTSYFVLALLFFSNKREEQVLERLHDLIR